MSLDLTTLGGYGNSTRDACYNESHIDVDKVPFADIAFEVCLAGGYNDEIYDYEPIISGSGAEWEEGSFSALTEGTCETNVVIGKDWLIKTPYGGAGGYSCLNDMAGELVAGAELLITPFALNDTSCTDDAIIAKLGKCEFVTLVETPKDDFGRGNTAYGQYSGWTDVKLYFDRKIEIDLDHFKYQAVLVNRYRNFSIAAGETYSGFKYGGYWNNEKCGGLRVIKCNGTFTMEEGAKIDLTGCGLPSDLTEYRPLLPHERSGVGAVDTDSAAGSENSITHDHFLLNVGDGAIMIIARNIVFQVSGTARIGNPNSNGVHYCRGADDSVNTPSGVTNVGGSTIFLAAETITNFSSHVISKYRTGTSSDGNGKGLARCYIATADTRHANANSFYLPTDEGLYAHDVLHDANSLTTFNGILNFGGGGAGTRTISGTQELNNFAHVTAFGNGYVDVDAFPSSSDYFKPSFAVGTLVMTHLTKTGSNQLSKVYNGHFILARITGIDGNRIYLDRGQIPGTVTDNDAIGQIIAIPEFKNLTVSGVITPSKGFSAAEGCGGIIALAVSDTLNLSGGKVNVEGMGAERSWQNAFEGNRYMVNTLPIGAGHGSVFILAKNIIMDANARIGATYTGKKHAGKGGQHNGTTIAPPAGGGYHGGGGDYGGHGGDGGSNSADFAHYSHGGWHGNGETSDSTSGGYGLQGAHLFIVANSITGFNLAAISTGGSGGRGWGVGADAGAGYGGGGGGSNVGEGARFGGGGGFQGGGAGGGNPAGSGTGCGGGGAGACVIYCNEAVNPDYAYIQTS